MQQVNSKETATIGGDSEAAQGPVLFLMNALGVGGSERKTVSVVNALCRRGFRVHVAYLDNRTPLLRFLSPGVTSIYLGRKGRLSVSAMIALRNYIDREKIGKVVCVSLYPLLYAMVAIRLLARRRRPSVMVMINATTITERKVRGQMLLYRHLMKRTEKIVFGCRVQMDLWCSRYRLDARKCAFIYNGIDEQRFQSGSTDHEGSSAVMPTGIRPEDFLIGAVGTLWSNKNHAELLTMLISAKANLPDAKLVIVGEGPERQRLVELVGSGGLTGRVYLLGEVEDVRPVLHRIDVFVLPSISETFSNAVLEAMAMEKVVIVSDTGGMREMVTDGVDGYLYKQGEVRALASLIGQLASDPEKGRIIGRNARKTVLNRFTFQRMVGEYVQLLG